MSIVGLHTGDVDGRRWREGNRGAEEVGGGEGVLINGRAMEMVAV